MFCYDMNLFLPTLFSFLPSSSFTKNVTTTRFVYVCGHVESTVLITLYIEQNY